MRNRKDLIIKLENLEFESRLKCKSDNYRFVDEGEVVTYTNRAPLTLLRFQIREHAGYYEIDDFEIINEEDNKMNEFKKGDRVELKTYTVTNSGFFVEGDRGVVTYPEYTDSTTAVEMEDGGLLICNKNDFKLVKEDNKMNGFKEQLHQTFESVAELSRHWENLDNHERATVERVAQETGFDELGNFEEVVDKFKQFYLQMQRTTVIDEYQVWIDDNNQLCFKQASVIGRIKGLDGVKKAVNGWFIKPVPKETMLKILDWYIEEN